MVMTLVLDIWETFSLTAGCNLYSTNFRLCALTVKKVHHQQVQNITSKTITRTISAAATTAASNSLKSLNMYFREKDRPVVDADTFLATAIPKILMASLIIFLNGLAIITLVRSSKWMSTIGTYAPNKGFYFLPQSTQGLLHSLFIAYLAMGLLTLYSQLSLSAFILGEFRFWDEQGNECLIVNCALISLSIAISLHLVSLAVDRTLAAYLDYAKYTQMAKGTVPLWLLAIWLPSGILGALPISGWRNNFNFCIFLHQFNDDYLRFVSGFYFASISLMPLLYLYFNLFLKRTTPDSRTIYRWHRKLQSHHRLTFVSILSLNAICWTPFHLYLILCCLSCSFPSFGTGFLQEYLFIIALLPSIAIPMMFTIRSSILDQCAAKISRFVHFREEGDAPGIFDTNPLSRYSMTRKSPLFYIDEKFHSIGSSSTYKDTLSSKKGNFFVPRYLPTTGTSGGSGRSHKYIKNSKQNNRFYKTEQMSKNYPGYLNSGYEEPIYANGDILLRASSASTQETDSQCGFPIQISKEVTGQIPPVPNRKPNANANRNIQEDPYYSTILSTHNTQSQSVNQR